MPAGLQETFLAQCRQQNARVTIELVNGSRLTGVIRGFDPFTVLIESDGAESLVYKHAIAAILPLNAGNGAATP